MSVAANLDDENDQTMLRGLVAEADVVVDNFRARARMGRVRAGVTDTR